MNNEEIAKEVFEYWDCNCTDDDFYDNCIETISEMIGFRSGGVMPDRVIEIWNIIEEKYL